MLQVIFLFFIILYFLKKLVGSKSESESLIFMIRKKHEYEQIRISNLAFKKWNWDAFLNLTLKTRLQYLELVNY